MRADHYDEFADGYDAENAASLVNAYYERPAMIDLAGDVRGRRILDAGCGSGPLSAALRERGAEMTGIDGSPAMLDLARARLGADVPLQLADLAEPLPFPDDSFDDVVASLVLHYLPDWAAALAELRRVLKPGGRLIGSVNHPFARAYNYPDADYFAVEQFSEEYDFAGTPGVLTYWHRPLHTIIEEFVSAGFEIKVIDEPAHSPDTPSELLPPLILSGERTRFMSFLFFVLVAP
ncbi:MAG: methyltransferase domain-containing protein [Microbacterium sp.]|jgi:ubiquinone/menaquinone biosynthesis C-methylase UbiE|nr:methyltransferase domain-containing protein [Microbacterium sp.]